MRELRLLAKLKKDRLSLQPEEQRSLEALAERHRNQLYRPLNSSEHRQYQLLQSRPALNDEEEDLFETLRERLSNQFLIPLTELEQKELATLRER